MAHDTPVGAVMVVGGGIGGMQAALDLAESGFKVYLVEADTAVGLRVYVYSGGCSGYRYGMMLEDQPADEDVKVQSKGINVYVDAQSTSLLQGSEIDYVDTLMGAGFTVNNPNAVSGCGCGSSFRTDESAGAPGACGH